MKHLCSPSASVLVGCGPSDAPVGQCKTSILFDESKPLKSLKCNYCSVAHKHWARCICIRCCVPLEHSRLFHFLHFSFSFCIPWPGYMMHASYYLSMWLETFVIRLYKLYRLGAHRNWYHEINLGSILSKSLLLFVLVVSSWLFHILLKFLLTILILSKSWAFVFYLNS